MARRADSCSSTCHSSIQEVCWSAPSLVDLESGESGIIHRQEAAIEGEHVDAVSSAVEDPSPEFFALPECLLGLLAFGRVGEEVQRASELPSVIAERASRHDRPDLSPVPGAEAYVGLLADTGPPILEQLASPRLVGLEQEIPLRAAKHLLGFVAEHRSHALD